jgi:LysM repeat protein
VARLGRAGLTRYGAPAAFLAAATVAVLLVRAGLKEDEAVPTTPTAAATVRAAPAPAQTTAKRRRRAYYRLEAGDTLETVATKYDTTVHQLLLFNTGVKPTSLRIGQKLRVR